MEGKPISAQLGNWNQRGDMIHQVEPLTSDPLWLLSALALFTASIYFKEPRVPIVGTRPHATCVSQGGGQDEKDGAL